MLPDAAAGTRVGGYGRGPAGAGGANGFSGEGNVNVLGGGSVLGPAGGPAGGLASGDLNLIRGFLRKVREQRERQAKQQQLSASEGADAVAGERGARGARAKSERGKSVSAKEAVLLWRLVLFAVL